jgi:hypothetical protein
MSFKTALLSTALGKTYDSMVSTFTRYPGLRGAHMVDIIMRSDGKETRIQADWLKEIVRLVIPFDPTPFKDGPPSIDAIDAHLDKAAKDSGLQSSAGGYSVVPIDPPKKNEITDELGWGAIPHIDADEGTLITYIDMGFEVRSIRVDLSRRFRPFFMTPHVDDAALEKLKDALRKEPGDTLYYQKGLNGFFLCTYDRGK